jgi:hypothetical protein
MFTLYRIDIILSEEEERIKIRMTRKERESKQQTAPTTHHQAGLDCESEKVSSSKFQH